MSASLKDPHGQTDDPSLNGGRTPRNERQNVPGHFAVNIGVIVILVVTAVALFCCTACGPTTGKDSGNGTSVQGAKDVTDRYDRNFPKSLEKDFDTMVGTYGAITAEANTISVAAHPDQSMINRCYRDVDTVNALRTKIKNSKLLSAVEYNAVTDNGDLVPNTLSHKACLHHIK